MSEGRFESLEVFLMQTLQLTIYCFLFFAYILWAAWFVQTRRGAASEWGTALLLCALSLVLWRWIHVAALAAVLLFPLGALLGLILLAMTAGEARG